VFDQVLEEAMANAGVSVDEVDWLLLHQVAGLSSVEHKRFVPRTF
jgi:3-oxoacyl-[acyl-carrier-protein] synthase III